MVRYVLEREYEGKAELSAKVTAAAGMFGLATAERKRQVVRRVEVRIERGQVVYITGGSGAGKSSVLRLLRERMAGAVDLREQEVPRGKAVVDCWAGELRESLYWLSLAGLSEAPALLSCAEELSDGQLYRLRLALAMARRAEVICIDEFCATLDRVTAAVVAHNVRRCADRFGTTFVVATSHDDLLEDLRPDVVMIQHLGGCCDVYYPKYGRGKGEIKYQKSNIKMTDKN